MIIKKTDYIQTVRINFGELLGQEKDEEAFVVLKEMPTITTVGLAEKKEGGKIVELMEYFKQILPGLIVEHPFFKDENTKMSNEEVVDIVFSRLDITEKVLDGYNSAVFHSRPNNAKEK